MASITVASRAHRILKALESYRSQDSTIAGLDLQIEEQLIGFYESDKGNGIAVTSEGLHLQNIQKWDFISFEQIEKPETPIEKTEVKGFNLKLNDGSKAWLPVSGLKNRRFYDAFEFIRFIDRVTEDQRSKGGYEPTT